MSRPTIQPSGYGEVLDRLKAEVRATRIQAQRAVNAELLGLFWTIGTEILQQQQARGWGAKVIDQLARDLREEFPGMRGLNRANLYSMRAFAAAWPDREIVSTVLRRLSWSHVRCLLTKLDDPSDREWYATEAGNRGWSLSVLEHQIAIGLRARVAAAPSNFAGQLPAPDSGLAQQLTKDPYVFDFLDLTDSAVEREIEQALMDRLQETLLPLWDHRLGGELSVQAVSGQLRWAATLLDAQATRPDVRADLHSAVGNLAQVAAWMSVDGGTHDSIHSYSDMSRQMFHLGRYQEALSLVEQAQVRSDRLSASGAMIRTCGWPSWG